MYSVDCTFSSLAHSDNFIVSVDYKLMEYTQIYVRVEKLTYLITSMFVLTLYYIFFSWV